MKLINVETFCCCASTNLYIGEDTSPEPSVILQLISDYSKSNSNIQSGSNVDADNIYLSCKYNKDDDVKKYVKNLLKQNGYTLYEPPSISIGD